MGDLLPRSGASVTILKAGNHISNKQLGTHYNFLVFTPVIKLFSFGIIYAMSQCGYRLYENKISDLLLLFLSYTFSGYHLIYRINIYL